MSDLVLMPRKLRDELLEVVKEYSNLLCDMGDKGAEARVDDLIGHLEDCSNA